MEKVISAGMAVTAVVLAGCGEDRTARSDRLDSSAARAAAVQLDDAQLAALQAQYPRLGTEPLPEPQAAADADPTAVPQQVPARALETVFGDATFYTTICEGRRTASGIPFRHNQMVAGPRHQLVSVGPSFQPRGCR